MPDPPDPADPRLREITDQVARLSGENARLLQRLGEGERRLRLLSRGVLRVQEAERGRIARELHDGVGQALTALKMELELLGRDAAGADGTMAARLRELALLAERSLQDVRQISHLLRPQILDELGLAPTLRWLARTLEARTGLKVDVQHEGIDERLDPEAETVVFRVAQEALNNVAKHAASPMARLTVRAGEGRVRVRVEDQGSGFDASAALDATADDRGFGLRGMRDRVALFGGRFAVRSAPGEGTTIEAEVPLDTPHARAEGGA